MWYSLEKFFLIKYVQKNLDLVVPKNKNHTVISKKVTSAKKVTNNETQGEMFIFYFYLNLYLILKPFLSKVRSSIQLLQLFPERDHGGEGAIPVASDWELGWKNLQLIAEKTFQFPYF